jgi:predicted ester cyclase
MATYEALQPREVAASWFERVWNRKEPKAIHDLMAPSAEGRSEGGTVRGPHEFENLVYRSLVTAFPDIRVLVQGIVTEGDQSVVRWKATAVHSGPFAGIEPSNKGVSFSGMTWLRIRDGKILEGEDRYNLHALMQYLSGGQASATVAAPE